MLANSRKALRQDAVAAALADPLSAASTKHVRVDMDPLGGMIIRHFAVK